MATLLRDRPHLTSFPTIGPPIRKDQAKDLHVSFSLGLRVCFVDHVCRNIFGLITVDVPKFEDEIGVFSGNLGVRD